MAKIDLEKLVCSLAYRKYFSEEKLQDALKEQGLEYKDGEIVEIQKSKFKVGDWIVQEDIGVYKVIEVCESWYEVVDNEDKHYSIGFDKEYMCHIWTIQDAKDGDVLYDISDSGIEYIVMNKGINMYNNVDSYFRYQSINGFAIDIPSVLSAENDSITPATKEQRDLLFQKMKEAGYEWDADKKELKKIDNRFEGEHANIQQKDYSPEEDEELFFGDYRKTDSGDKGKASFANRQVYNRAILKILSDYIEKYPDIRFGQMLCNLDIKPHFDEESRETYCNLNETINKSKDESKN